MLNQLQRGDEPALLPCRRSGFLRRPYLGGGEFFRGGAGLQAAHRQAPPLATAGAAQRCRPSTPLKPKAGLCAFGHPVLPARLAS
jgi:hypothetical protein